MPTPEEREAAQLEADRREIVRQARLESIRVGRAAVEAEFAPAKPVWEKLNLDFSHGVTAASKIRDSLLEPLVVEFKAKEKPIQDAYLAEKVDWRKKLEAGRKVYEDACKYHEEMMAEYRAQEAAL